jgi:uncharacterized protein (TIGR02118 family)
MIRLMVTYPRGEETTFDADYWTGTHMPLVSSSWSEAVRWEADLAAADSPNHGIAHIYFDSAESMAAAMGGPNTGAVMGDIVNYTNVQPVIQVYTVAASS